MIVQSGYGEADITPPTETPLSGFASRVESAEGVLRPLTARVLALATPSRRIVLIALDLIGPPDDFARLIAARLPGDVTPIIAATHTHSGPPVLDRALLGLPNLTYVDFAVDACVRAAAAALADLAPCRVAHRKVRAAGIAFNRRDPDGPVDHNADVTTFHRGDAGLRHLWVNFACHPVVLGPNNLRYSPDFPGEARANIEADLGVPVIYTTGTCGQINLGHSALDSIRKTGMDRRTATEAARIGRVLSDAILFSIRGVSPQPVDPAGLAYASERWPARLADVDAAQRHALDAAARTALANPDLTAGEKRMAELDLAWLARQPAGFDLEVGGLALGDIHAVFLPGEIFVETGLALQQQLSKAIVVGYAHSNPGYIPHRTAEGRGGYEVDVAWRAYGAAGPFASGTGAEVEKRALAVALRARSLAAALQS